MIKITAEVSMKLPKIDVSEEGKKKLAELLRDHLKKQAKDGIQATSEGRSRVMPKGADGKRIDLVDTGAMWREVRFEPLKLVFLVPYAQWVIPKYAAGLFFRQAEFYREKALPIVKKHLIFQKEGQ